ncbi:hypothetical protein FHS41_007423 [Streptomyces violarus]|uniref:Uncharacterized protein n=1 Tax=Streptomyces violarus TaxID=67380 RepID=A0A7W5F5U3_9ACTN|nr:hypothetical protein [Streptomyces violarus]
MWPRVFPEPTGVLFGGYQRYQRPLRSPVSALRITKPSSQTTSTTAAIHHSVQRESRAEED